MWRQENKHNAALVLDDWNDQARGSGLTHLITAADTFQKHRDGILAWYDIQISNGKLEGINNKIKTMKRQAYGYRDMPFFKIVYICKLNENVFDNEKELVKIALHGLLPVPTQYVAMCIQA